MSSQHPDETPPTPGPRWACPPSAPRWPPGWYPDPWRVGALRYFDGWMWSAATAAPLPTARSSASHRLRPVGWRLHGGGWAAAGAAAGIVFSTLGALLVLPLTGASISS